MLHGWHERCPNLFLQQGVPIVTIKEAMILDLVGAFIPDPHLGVLVQQLIHQISIHNIVVKKMNFNEGVMLRGYCGSRCCIL